MAGAKYVRPQKHNSWFAVIAEQDVSKMTSSRVDFLDSFVSLETDPSGGYQVRYEGQIPLICEMHFGFICVWFGDDLEHP